MEGNVTAIDRNPRSLAPARPPASARRTSQEEMSALRYRVRRRQRRCLANSRCARRQRHRSWDETAIALSRSRPPLHTGTRKGTNVGIRCREAVRERLQEGDDLVLLRIGQAKLTTSHIDIVRDLGHRPAVLLFNFSHWAVSGSDGERIYVARIIEMD